MNYYEILVGDMHYHGSGALTYSSEARLAAGSVVRIALRERSVLGIVLREVRKPDFAVKPIAAAADAPPIPAETLALLEWLHGYYPAPFGAIIRQFLPPSTAFPKKVTPAPAATAIAQKTLPKLTPQQDTALKDIAGPGSYLLHGITGSGKTRIYLELARRTLDTRRSVVMLTPEIGLTAQLTTAFEAQFPGHVHVIHSRLTAAERRDIWYALLQTDEPQVIIGPRSALFAPIRSIGMIIMDESHDQAYKSDTAPRYRTERVAAKLAHLHQAVFVSGSATPNIEDYYVAVAKNRPVISLDKLAKTHDTQTHISAVDLRDKDSFTRSRFISTPLLDAMQAALERGEQSMLFLNRRGTANAIVCNACGWQAMCEHCDLPLTYHGDTHSTRCHVCGRTSSLPQSCPVCGETDILLKTIGTKAVVEEVRRLFPSARLQRFDTDVAKEDHLDRQLDKLLSGEVDIIIGTQMITKGLDLPKLAVVGILSADGSLLIPDYTANERTFQLLAQVIGRIGRGHRDGMVFVQTYNPDHSVIQAALKQNWRAFYEVELAERSAYHFPPFAYLVRLICLRATSASAEKAALKLRDELKTRFPKLRIEGPSPAFHPRESGKYKWQLIIKSPSRTALLRIVDDLPSGWQHDLDPANLL